MKEKHVVMFSSGAGSAYLSKYVIDKYGKENTILLMTDTKWEDEDNYRFSKEVSDYVGLPITFHNDGRTPEEVFKEENYFGNFGTAPCSKQLKMNMTFEFVQKLIAEDILPILYFGIDYEESKIAPRIAYNYKHNVDIFEDGVEVRFPLIAEYEGHGVNGDQLLFGTDYMNSGKINGETRVSNKDVYEALETLGASPTHLNTKEIISKEWGIKLPRMYELGFSHANCGGRCIKGGKRHFATLYSVWKDRFDEIEQIEREINEKQKEKGNKPYTILSRKDAFGRKVSYSLENYRKEELEDPQCELDLFGEEDLPCTCVF